MPSLKIFLKDLTQVCNGDNVTQEGKGKKFSSHHLLEPHVVCIRMMNSCLSDGLLVALRVLSSFMPYLNVLMTY